MDRIITQGLDKHKHIIRIFSAENRCQWFATAQVTPSPPTKSAYVCVCIYIYIYITTNDSDDNNTNNA